MTKAIMTAVFAASLLARGAAADVAGVCNEWKVVSTPEEWDGVDPTAIAALDDSNAWAIGHHPVDPAVETKNGGSPVVMHWDGFSWLVEKLPDLAYLGTQPTLQAVDIAPRGAPWIVGHLRDKADGTNVPLILQWQGGFWQVHRIAMLDSFAPRQARLRHVAALTDEAAWAVGDAATIVTGGPNDDARLRNAAEPFAARWDGTAWVEVAVPGTGGHAVLTAVSAATDQAVWAVGYALDDKTGDLHALIYRWDGTEWSVADQPAAGKAGSVLHDVVALAANDVWAVGAIGTDAGLFLHFDGATWTSHPAPAKADLRSVDGAASDDVWAVGATGRYRWDGKGWSVDEEAGRAFTRRAVAVAGPCDAWAVSAGTLASDTVAFVERLVPDKTPTPTPELPPTPAGLVAIPKDDMVWLQWVSGGTTSHIPIQNGFVIERCTGEAAACVEPFAAIGETKAIVFSYGDSGLKPETTYSYRVYAVSDAGRSQPTAAVTVVTSPIEEAPAPAETIPTTSIPTPLTSVPAASETTGGSVGGNSLPQAPNAGTVIFAPAPRPALPAKPVSLVAKASSEKEITLSWLPGDAQMGVAFVIQRCAGTEKGCLSRFSVVAKVETTSYVDSGLAPGTFYGYRVFAVNAAGKSAPSDTVIVSTPAATSPPTSRLQRTKS